MEIDDVVLKISNQITIPQSELSFDFIRASGPGGQNINKVSSAVQLRFDVLNSAALPEQVKQRLLKLTGKRISSEGVLLIEAKRYRNQERNKQDSLDRLAGLIQKALQEPKKRKKTQPSRAEKERHLAEKRKRSQLKSSRQTVRELDE